MWTKSWIELFGAIAVKMAGRMSVWMCVWLFIYYFLYFCILIFYLFVFGKVVDISWRDGILIYGFND